MDLTKIQISNFRKVFAILFILISLCSIEIVNAGTKKKPTIPPVRIGDTGKLVYTVDSLGNRIPDYSYCGYQLSEKEIPFVKTAVVIPYTNGDITSDLQKAIDYISDLKPDKNGFRGAIQFEAGTYHLLGRFRIEASGIVFRGTGFGEDGTVLKIGGTERETLFRVKGGSAVIEEPSVKISNAYIPVNAMSFEVEGGNRFKVGDAIFITRPATKEWIDLLGMKNFGGETDWLGWRIENQNITWDRVITKIEGNTIFIDAPITTALDEKFGGAFIQKYSWDNRISKIGFENLSLISDYDQENPKDEEHCWNAISFENAENCWVRQANFKHFAGSAVAVYKTASKVTVEDCKNMEPVSEVAAYRRNAFFVEGEQTLVQRCYAEFGWHDFSTGFMTAGPNAFVQCESHLPNNFSGCADSWASGILFDIVNVDGNKLSFVNRGQDAQGAGFTAANSMFWQCSAAKIENFAPTGAMNWAIGTWAQFAGNGYWYEANSHVTPRSLFYKQLEDRIGENNVDKNPVITYNTNATSSPTVEQAAEIVKHFTEKPNISLTQFIDLAVERNPLKTDFNAKSIADIKTKKVETHKQKHFNTEIINGWIVFDGKVVTGSRASSPWWTMNVRPRGIMRSEMAVTRYVPGREGKGFTDNLNDVISEMNKKNIAVYEQNYALWYERRRDDHERIRRMDGDVWAPFYELPFERSGQGLAWDGLSKYDLTKYNVWYWNRLKQFADLAEQNQKILIHQNYFQHNILEAGAHWVDSPWRTVNNINNTGFPEPPPFAGDKRIFIADEFYDITHPIRRELHRKYIRQCLENFKENSCVIQTTSEEFTGPLHFVEFWIDVIAEWEQETGKHPLIALSTTKDVQDAILADPVRSKIVDVIDIRYWSSRADGTVYAPAGGVNLAPRQHARQEKPGKRSMAQVYNDVLTYRRQFPSKAVIYSESQYRGLEWGVFMAGGSLAPIPEMKATDFLKNAATMIPVKSTEGTWKLANEKGEEIIYVNNIQSLEYELNEMDSKFMIDLINSKDGSMIKENAQKEEAFYENHSGMIVWAHKK